MYVYTHTHARGGCKGAFGPPPATTPPVGKVGSIPNRHSTIGHSQSYQPMPRVTSTISQSNQWCRIVPCPNGCHPARWTSLYNLQHISIVVVRN